MRGVVTEKNLLLFGFLSYADRKFSILLYEFRSNEDVNHSLSFPNRAKTLF